MEIKVICKETIKPSRPTPAHQRRLQFSFLDQTNRRSFLPMIYYYHHSAATNLNRSDKLKKSLAETLSCFYPLAGRVKDLFTDCNDEGVPFSEAQAKCQLSQVVGEGRTNLARVNSLLPFFELDDAGDLPLAIRVTFFDCGGMAVGVCMSHKIADGWSLTTFVNCWAAIARSDCPSKMVGVSLQFNFSKLFPPRRDMPPSDDHMNFGKEMIVAKVFVFSPSAISTLRAKYASSSTYPSRFEALSAFIFSRFVAATRRINTKQPHEMHYLVFYNVNLRARMNLPVPESCFGNLVGRAMVVVQSMDITSATKEGFVTRSREGVRRIDGGFVKKLQEGKLQFNYNREEADLKSIKGEAVPISFTGANNFPLYEADFGWGRPVWVSMAKELMFNVINLLPTRSGYGIEASVHMKEDGMAKLEGDEEFLAFVSPSKVHFSSSL